MDVAKRKRGLWLSLAGCLVLGCLGCWATADSANQVALGWIEWGLPLFLVVAGFVGGVLSVRGPLREPSDPKDVHVPTAMLVSLAVALPVVASAVFGISRDTLLFVAASVFVGALSYFLSSCVAVLIKMRRKGRKPDVGGSAGTDRKSARPH